MTDKKDPNPTAGTHEATWGATEAAKAAWEDRNGDRARKATEAANDKKAVGE